MKYEQAILSESRTLVRLQTKRRQLRRALRTLEAEIRFTRKVLKKLSVACANPRSGLIPGAVADQAAADVPERNEGTRGDELFDDRVNHQYRDDQDDGLS